MVVHVQPVSSASRRNLLTPARTVAVGVRPVAAPAGPAAAPARPAAAPAAVQGYNFVWRNFHGIEENPNGEKRFLDIQGHREKQMLLILRVNTSTFSLIRM